MESLGSSGNFGGARRSIDSAPIRSACQPRAPRSATSPVGTSATSAGNRPTTDSRQTGHARFSHHLLPRASQNACDLSCQTLGYKAIKAHQPTGILKVNGVCTPSSIQLEIGVTTRGSKRSTLEALWRREIFCEIIEVTCSAKKKVQGIFKRLPRGLGGWPPATSHRKNNPELSAIFPWR